MIIGGSAHCDSANDHVDQISMVRRLGSSVFAVAHRPASLATPPALCATEHDGHGTNFKILASDSNVARNLRTDLRDTRVADRFQE
jgi:hypothetical protein